VKDFVEQCRAEWRRLGVPDPLAEEMAADLSTDLAEAEAEGVSAEELLGSSVFDPRSFAAEWASERGVVPAAPDRRKARRRPLVLAAFTAAAALTVIVAALLLLTGEPKVSLVATSVARAQVPPPAAFVVPPGSAARQVVLNANTSAPIEWILLFVAVAVLGFATWLWVSWGRSRPPTAPV
jgi:hypothetical protein